MFGETHSGIFAAGTGLPLRSFGRGHRKPMELAMKKFLLSGAAVALIMGTSAAFAQTTQTTTTYSQSPDTTTSTTETKSDNMDGTYTQYKKTVTSTRQYDAGVWTPPADYSVHRISLGDRLPADLMTNTYYLTNYSSYNLVAPPEGAVWVRVGQDAYLVRNDDGEVIQADYGVFM
jgi:Ni/Co efflux regulator RcnB